MSVVPAPGAEDVLSFYNCPLGNEGRGVGVRRNWPCGGGVREQRQVPNASAEPRPRGELDGRPSKEPRGVPAEDMLRGDRRRWGGAGPPLRQFRGGYADFCSLNWSFFVASLHLTSAWRIMWVQLRCSFKVRFRFTVGKWSTCILWFCTPWSSFHVTSTNSSPFHTSFISFSVSSTRSLLYFFCGSFKWVLIFSCQNGRFLSLM